MTTPTKLGRKPERGAYDRRALDAVLDAGHHVCTLSTVVDGDPWVVPMLYARVGDRILLHGSTGAGALRRVAAGARAAVSVMHLDGWVYSYSLFDSSANYRSAIVYGALTRVAGDEASDALTAMSEVVFPGRSGEVRAHSRKDLAATQCLSLPITEGDYLVKVRDGGIGDADGEEIDPQVWTGVLPIHTAYGTPQPSEFVPDGLPVAASIRKVVEGN